MRDITNEKIIKERNFGGANGNKISMEIDSHLYVVKIPPSREDMGSNDSYSEHVASSIANLLGYNSHETKLATMDTPQGVKTVVCCKDLTESYDSLTLKITPFYDVLNALYKDERAGRDTKFTSILAAAREQNLVDKDELCNFIADTFMIDTLLGNFDRHNGNWGLIIPEEGEAIICPRYDFGSCLLSRANEEIINNIMSDSGALNQRIYQFPTSAIKDDKNRKINYYDFLFNLKDNLYLSEGEKRLFFNAMEKISDKYLANKDNILSFIDNQEIPSNLKEFYKIYISAREERIIEKAIENNKDYFKSETKAKSVMKDISFLDKKEYDLCASYDQVEDLDIE